jgi:hypothetical protein
MSALVGGLDEVVQDRDQLACVVEAENQSLIFVGVLLAVAVPKCDVDDP